MHLYSHVSEDKMAKLNSTFMDNKATRMVKNKKKKKKLKKHMMIMESDKATNHDILHLYRDYTIKKIIIYCICIFLFTIGVIQMITGITITIKGFVYSHEEVHIKKFAREIVQFNSDTRISSNLEMFDENSDLHKIQSSLTPIYGVIGIVKGSYAMYIASVHANDQLVLFGIVMFINLITVFCIITMKFSYVNMYMQTVDTIVNQIIEKVYDGLHYNRRAHLVESGNSLARSLDYIMIRFSCCGGNSNAKFSNASKWYNYMQINTDFVKMKQPLACCKIKSKENFPNNIGKIHFTYDELVGCIRESNPLYTNLKTCNKIILDGITKYTNVGIQFMYSSATFAFLSIVIVAVLVYLLWDNMFNRRPFGECKANVLDMLVNINMGLVYLPSQEECISHHPDILGRINKFDKSKKKMKTLFKIDQPVKKACTNDSCGYTNLNIVTKDIKLYKCFQKRVEQIATYRKEHGIGKEFGKLVKFKKPSFMKLVNSVLSDYPGNYVLAPNFDLIGGTFRENAVLTLTGGKFKDNPEHRKGSENNRKITFLENKHDI